MFPIASAFYKKQIDSVAGFATSNLLLVNHPAAFNDLIFESFHI